MVGNNSSGKYLLSISYEKRDSVLVKQHVASHTRTILLQHNLNLNSLFPADIILEINKTSLLSKSGVERNITFFCLSQFQTDYQSQVKQQQQQKYRTFTWDCRGLFSKYKETKLLPGPKIKVDVFKQLILYVFVIHVWVCKGKTSEKPKTKNFNSISINSVKR